VASPDQLYAPCAPCKRLTSALRPTRALLEWFLLYVTIHGQHAQFNPPFFKSNENASCGLCTAATTFAGFRIKLDRRRPTASGRHVLQLPATDDHAEVTTQETIHFQTSLAKRS
jgi:hypothetical protein